MTRTIISILRSVIRLFPGRGSSDGPSTRRLVRTPGLLAGRDTQRRLKEGFWGFRGFRVEGLESRVQGLGGGSWIRQYKRTGTYQDEPGE